MKNNFDLWQRFRDSKNKLNQLMALSTEKALGNLLPGECFLKPGSC